MRRLSVAVLLFATLTLGGCALPQMIKLAQEQNLVVTPAPLEVHADTVEFEMSADLPVKMLKKGKVYTLVPIYKYGGEQLVLDSVDFVADDYPNSDVEAPRVQQKFSFPYTEAMKKGELIAEGIASDPRNGKFKKLPAPFPITVGVITTSQLVLSSGTSAFAAHGYNPEPEYTTTAVDFYFEQGRSTLRRSEVRSERGNELDAYIAAKNITKTVTITGTHSPEGPERINSGLASERAEAIVAFYTDQLKKYGYDTVYVDADSIQFISKDVVEDWTNFKAALSNYDGVTDTQKEAILSIVNGGGTFEDKEAKLQQLDSYKKIFNDIYPDLRNAKTEILTQLPKLTDAEISILAKQIVDGSVSADTLDDDELMYAATLTPTLKEKEGIYKAATKKSDSYASHNNLGAVYLAQALKATDDNSRTDLLDEALTQFEIASKKAENAEVLINLGTVYALQGNTYKALAALEKAVSKRPAADMAAGMYGVLGAMQIRAARYSDAVASLTRAERSYNNVFNKGLAQLLNKDFGNAMVSFKEAISSDNGRAEAYYGAAVTAARQQNVDALIENLKGAFNADPELKKVALNDLEFKNFVASAAFQALFN